MPDTELQPVVDAVLRKAQQQGFILPREVRELLSQGGKDEALWRRVVSTAGAQLRYRGGRYYPAASSERVRREQDQQQSILRAVRQMIRLHRTASRKNERREQTRTDFIQPVKVHTEDGREHTLLSRDISPTGIRLIGTRRLLGQKVRVTVSAPEGEPGTPRPPGWTFLVRVLWTIAIGEDLFENGGTFLEMMPGS
jgi:hypothetical protein